MKIKKVNKILASIMLFLILFSIIQPVFAASGSGKWSGGQYASGMKTTDNANGTTGVLIRRLNNLNTGERRTVFCAEHGIDFKTGASYNGVYYTPTNSNIRKACKVAYLGWYKNNGGYTVDGGILANDMKWVKWDYVFTQQYIWEILGQSNATFIKSDEQQGYIDFKNRINNEIADIEKRPSFNGSTITIQAGETKTITDSNGVLAEYGTIDNTKDGIRFVHQNGSNSMTIFVDENTNLENYRISDNTFKEWGMIKNGTEDNDTMVYFEFASGVQNQLYCMSYNDPVTLNFSLEIETFGRLELQKLNTNGDLVNGAVFKVRGANDYNKDVTVTNGKITIDKLKKGTYTINEISVPFGYLIDTKSYDVEVKVNQTATKAIVNEEPTGEIKAYKTDNYNNKLKGAEISLYAREDIKNVAGTITWYKKGELITKAITNDDGMAQFSNLHLGKYYVKETNAPNGYLVNSKEFDTELKYKDANTKVIYIDVTGIKDEEPTGKITIIKKDAETGSVPQGDATFKNAVYELLDENYNFITDLIIDDSFSAKTDKILSPNKIYILREKTASEGYLLDKTEYRFKIDRDNLDIEMDVYEDVIEKTVNIYKVFADDSTTILKGEPNVSFEIYLKSTGEYYKTIKTDEKGFVSVKLPYGKWIFKQVSSTSGFEKVKDFEIVINNDSDEDITKIISNAEIRAKLKLIKVDSESRKILVRDGIKFRIKNLDTGEYVCQNVTYPGQEKICVFETKDGMFITPYVLGHGNYQIEELEEQSIPGYVWNSVPLKFSIDENSKFIQDDEFGLMLEVKFENKEVKGEIVIKKVGEKLVIENGTFRYEEIELDGVHYDLIADGDIYSGDGTLIYKDKQLIKSFVTKDGYFKLINLYLGKYCLIETKTVGNHVLNSEPYCFEIKYKDQYTDTIKLVINQKNYLAKGDFELSKVDLSTGEPVEGALIEIYTEDDILIYSGRTDKLGKLYVKGLESGKKYKFVEKEAPEGYILNDEIHEFEILNNGDIVKDTLSNEKIVIDVPNTFANDYKILIPVSLCGLGIILVLLSKDKRKKK